MIKINEAIIVEGKYDKIKLNSFLDCPIIETNGFRVFKDKEKQSLINQLAQKRGIIIMTDSDSAGFMIRNFLQGVVDNSCIKHCYLPQILGKEKRKDAPSKEGLLGVEGVEEKIIIEALEKCGVNSNYISVKEKTEITKSDLYEYGYIGRENSKALRESLLLSLNMPKYLSSNAFLTVINSLYTKEDFESLIDSK